MLSPMSKDISEVCAAYVELAIGCGRAFFKSQSQMESPFSDFLFWESFWAPFLYATGEQRVPCNMFCFLRLVVRKTKCISPPRNHPLKGQDLAQLDHPGRNLHLRLPAIEYRANPRQRSESPQILQRQLCLHDWTPMYYRNASEDGLRTESGLSRISTYILYNL